MAKIDGSVGITGIIAPKDEADSYAVTDPKYGLGGLRTVADLGEMYAIPFGRRQIGMVCYVTASGVYYSMIAVGTDGTPTTEVNWAVFVGGGGGGDIDSGTY